MIKKYSRPPVILFFCMVIFVLSGCAVKNDESAAVPPTETAGSLEGSTEQTEQPLQTEPTGQDGQADRTEQQKPAGETGGRFSDLDSSEYTGRYLRAKNGEDLVVIECMGPVKVTDRSKDGRLFEDMNDGDLVKVRLGSIEETYPGQSEIFTCTLEEKGKIEDIDGNTLKQLQEMGWLDESSLGKAEPKQMVYLRDKLFTSTGREAYVTCGTADGQITSVTSGYKIPQENGQANFNCKGTDYITVDEEGAAVLMDGKYILFLTENAVDYEGKCYRKADLSKETLDWLTFYNSLSKEGQMSISMVPHEFVPKGGEIKAEETKNGEN